MTAARALGASHARIITAHFLPNVIAPTLVLVTNNFSQFIILESALSFLGLGIPRSSPTWGRTLFEGRDCLTVAPWLITVPGLVIMLTVLSANLVGDGLRDALDPRLQGSHAHFQPAHPLAMAEHFDMIQVNPPSVPTKRS